MTRDTAGGVWGGGVSPTGTLGMPAVGCRYGCRGCGGAGVMAPYRRVRAHGVLEWYAPPFVAKRPRSGRSQGGAGSVSERQIDQVGKRRPADPLAARSQQPRRQVPVLRRASDPGTKDDHHFDGRVAASVGRTLEGGPELSAGVADFTSRS